MVSSNNAINNTVGASITGVTNTLTVTNPSNTASSAARTKITVGGASSADPTINFNVSGVTDFEMGIDNDASDSFKIAASSSLGTTDTFIMTTAGERTMPLQPSFFGKASTINNLTGDGTPYFVGDTDVGSALTEAFDQGGDFVPGASGGATFTAPVAGIYAFCASCNCHNLSAAHTFMQLDMYLNGSFYLTFDTYSVGAARNSSNVAMSQGEATVLLAASDVVKFRIVVSNSTKTVGIEPFVSGALLL